MTRRSDGEAHFTVSCENCPYEHTAKTRGLAEGALAKHSCAANLERAARTARRVEREQSSGVRRDCRHKRVHHEHGTRNAYVLDKCRCRACRDGNTQASRDRDRAQLYGRYESPYMDAEPVREHVEQLRSVGMGLKTIAARADVSNSTLGNLIYGRNGRTTGPSRQVRRHVAARVLAVKPDDLAKGACIDSTGTVRRIKALSATGWSLSELGRRLDITPSNMLAILDRPRVRASTARATRRLYDELWDTPPAQETWSQRIAYSRAHNYARKHGWLPPTAYDDYAMDDPDYQPDETAVQREASGVAIEDVEFVITTTGGTLTTVAERLGIKRDSLEARLHRAERRDLLTRMAANREAA